jgi:hypothetical protein
MMYGVVELFGIPPEILEVVGIGAGGSVVAV